MILGSPYKQCLLRAGVLVAGLIIFYNNLSAQQTPLNPVTSQVFTPFTINPAIAGSKDFMAFDLSATVQGTDKSILLSGNSRLAKKGPTYFGAPVSKEFTRFGAGLLLFNDKVGYSTNTGLGVTGSYHQPLDKKNLTFLAAGVTVKGFYNMMDSIPETEAPPKNSFIPNIDFGIYFYNETLSAGVSVTNILGSTFSDEDQLLYNIPVSRQYYFTAGYKILVNRALNIVIEPSIIINVDDSLDFSKGDAYNPMLKIYMEDFCFGTYWHDFEKLNFFFQYKFPRLYIGTLVDFPKGAPFFREELIVELTAGINFGNVSSGKQMKWHW